VIPREGVESYEKIMDYEKVDFASDPERGS
jgi:hypothetical protein